MAAGRPMVLSDIPVFREITENRGIYTPHNDDRAMARAIGKILASNNERKRLIEYGKKRVRDFSFNTLAAKLEGVYKSLIAHSFNR
jgi:glycosyltransferase involved in cell wall biosynthesis